MAKGNEKLELSEEELQFIEAQRKETEALEGFKAEYSELVKKTGFAWTVDGNSTLNNIKLTIGRVQR